MCDWETNWMCVCVCVCVCVRKTDEPMEIKRVLKLAFKSLLQICFTFTIFLINIICLLTLFINKNKFICIPFIFYNIIITK